MSEPSCKHTNLTRGVLPLPGPATLPGHCIRVTKPICGAHLAYGGHRSAHEAARAEHGGQALSHVVNHCYVGTVAQEGHQRLNILVSQSQSPCEH